MEKRNKIQMNLGMVIKVIEKICDYLTQKIKKQVPGIDDEKAEVINYGLQNLVGEFPKTFVFIAVSYLLGILKLFIIAFLIILPYRMVSGGFHLRTHLGCIIATLLMYCSNVYISQIIHLNGLAKYIMILLVLLFGNIMISKYAPADTEWVPILRKKDRKIKRILSHVILTIELIIAVFIKDNILSNLIIFGMLIQTCTITRFAYKLTKNKYGYEVYIN